jgi:hypothetical protein
MARRDTNRTRKGVVKMREGNFILGPDLLPNYDLVDIIKLVPILIKSVHVTVQRLKFGSPGIAILSALDLPSAYPSYTHLRATEEKRKIIKNKNKG